MSINEIQNQIIDDFSLFDNWEDKYTYLIELGKKLPEMSAEYKTDDYKIKGCQSNVWVKPSFDQNTQNIELQGDSDAVIVKGLVALLLQILSKQKAQEIAKADLYFIEKIGMAQNLSMTRANGLNSMIKQIKLYSLAYQQS
jgi:cysteine desulfuration protein SufE